MLLELPLPDLGEGQRQPRQEALLYLLAEGTPELLRSLQLHSSELSEAYVPKFLL